MSFVHRSIRYGDHALQTVDVWQPPVADRVPADGSNRYFIIYLHGGAWRDPSQVNETGIPAYQLLTSPDTASAYMGRDRIAGYASIGYRLSADPQRPQDPATTPANEVRAAKAPDHLVDVWAALAALAAEDDAKAGSGPGSPADYMVHDRYIVVGHSCGAFMAFQLWMGGQAVAPKTLPSGVPVPRCIVGLAGIYDLRGLAERGGNPAHGGGPGTGFAAVIQSIVEGAFGADRAVWDAVSPGRFDWEGLSLGDSKKSTPLPPRLAVLGYSSEDELVDVGEIDTMEAALRRGEQAGKLDLLVLRDLQGRHDEVHEKGHGVARVLTEAVKRLDG